MILDKTHTIDEAGNSALNNTYTINATASQILPAGTNMVVSLNNAAGLTLTLPSPSKAPIGTLIDCYITTVAAPGPYKIITDSATTFLAGGIFIDKALTVTRYAGDGTTLRSVNLNGTTTGGSTIADNVTFVLASPTVWNVTGTVTASGVLATPFATS